MALFLNWFAAEIAERRQSLPSQQFPSWEQCTEALKAASIPRHCSAQWDVKTEVGNQAIAVMVGDEKPAPDGFETREFDLDSNWSVEAKLLEYNLGLHLASRGFRVKHGRFVSSATTPAFKIEELGVVVESGVAFKPHYVRQFRKHGFTLDWKVSIFCEKTLDQLDVRFDPFLAGIPVILSSISALETPQELAGLEGKYAGKITQVKDRQTVAILCRDGVTRTFARQLFSPEPKPDVLSQLSQASPDLLRGDSIAKRVQVLGHGLTSGGRRNLRVMQDKLRAAVSALSPGNRPFLSIDLQPFGVGRMKISTAPAVARVEDRPYV